MTSRPRRAVSSTGLFRETLGPTEDCRERVVQFVRDAGDRLAKRGHLLRLQQLLIQVARLVVEPLSLAHIAQQCLDSNSRTAAHSICSSGDFDPHRLAVTSLQAKQIVGNGSLVDESCQERRSRGRIDEALRSKKDDLRFRRLRRVAEHDLEMWIGGESRSVAVVRNTTDRADVHALVYGFEEARERSRTLPIGNLSRTSRHAGQIIGGVPPPPQSLRFGCRCRRWEMRRVLALDRRANLRYRRA